MTGWFCDNFGRKWPMIVSTTLYSLTMMSGGFTTNVNTYLVVRFFQGWFNILAYIGGYCYLNEIVSIEWRAWAGYALHTLYTVGELLLVLMAYYIRDWRKLSIWTIVTLAPCVLYLFIPESPVYLFSKGKQNLASQIFQKIGKSNQKGSDLQEINTILTKVAEQTSEQNKEKDNKKWSIIDLFTHGRNLTLVSLKVGLMWLAQSTVYYGISLNAAQLPGSIFVNIAIYGIIDLFHFVFPLMLDNKFLGRSRTVSMSLLITGVCCLASTITSLYKPCENKVESGEASNWINYLTLVITFIGRYMIGGNFACVYQFSSELFPTNIRTNGMALGSTVGKIGSIFTPVILFLRILGDWVPGTIFGVLSILASFAALSLPETRGISVLNNLEEAELFYTGKLKNEKIPESAGETNLATDL